MPSPVTDHDMLRRAQQPLPSFDCGTMMIQPQQRGVQMQQQGTQKQEGQEQEGEKQAPPSPAYDAQDPSAPAPGSREAGVAQSAKAQLVEEATSPEEAADLDSALDDPAGDPRPVYDQYAVNSPHNMHGDTPVEQARRRDQAKRQDRESVAEIEEGE